jgi:hypothetical protein
LWCGSLGVKADRRLVTQLLYHAAVIRCDDEDVRRAQKDLLEGLASEFHRRDECKLYEQEG